MDDSQLIEDAVEHAIEEADTHAPVGPGADVDVLAEIATAYFNRTADEIGYEPDVTFHATLEVKCAAEAERQLERQ